MVQAGKLSYIFTQTKPAIYRRYRVQTGRSENGDVAITLLDTGADTTRLVRNGAYFIDAALKKGKQEEWLVEERHSGRSEESRVNHYNGCPFNDSREILRFALNDFCIWSLDSLLLPQLL
ncbi:hypothetical protein D0N36_09860 [Hymenobacter lapidiphilus]|uniref:hypothetical protein n=1 Tax=Hymenobacter sp. CCM 8763 TaxID=2303334 RepID=UPI000E3432CA|nr:hypothetical protein [Hymenobacter sp. CCM 8763]RFP65164.1 hypothetical protein D0N36_09860 [Hymenobacter sp. CCM 8763]